MPFQLIRQDITCMKVDAVVNAANEQLLPGGGVCGAIFQAAGYKKLEEACLKNGPCPTGSSAITPGFALSKYIIHSVGPVWHGGSNGERDQLASCYRSALQIAAEHELKSIAFPLISAGIYGFPQAEALRIASDTIQSWLLDENTPDLDVFLVLYGTSSYHLGTKLFGEIANYIDEHSPRFRAAEEAMAIRRANYPCSSLDQPTWLPMADINAPCMDADEESCDACFPDEPAFSEASFSHSVDPEEAAEWAHAQKRRSETFQQMLFRLIDETNETDAAIYKRANLDRRLFSKIRGSASYHPNKNTVLALCLALKLKTAAADRLLAAAGFALSGADEKDLAVRYCLQHGIYSVYALNEVLYELDLSPLGA